MLVLSMNKVRKKLKKLIDILQNEMGVKKIRFPETSGIGIKTVSQEGTSRLCVLLLNMLLKKVENQ